MTINGYQGSALRTANKKCLDLNNVGLGITGEAGECADIIKKHMFHGHPLDKEALAKELGDVCWYIAVTAHLIGYELEDIMELNIYKLNTRYPQGFDEQKSINREEHKK